MGAAWLLPRIVGLGRATELLMTGEFIDAAEALRIGLYNRVVPARAPGGGDARARGPPRARDPPPAWPPPRTRSTASCTWTWAALDQEARVQAELMSRPDFREGFAAFMAKRPPRFEGAPE